MIKFCLKLDEAHQYPYRTLSGHTITANYSGWYVDLHEDQSMTSYFTEDIGMNNAYYLFNIYFPTWMSSKQFELTKDRRGEMWFFILNQLLTRYEMERFSNGLGEVYIPSMGHPIKAGFYPSMQYPDGLGFPTRPDYTKLSNVKSWHAPKIDNYTEILKYVEDMSRRIRDALDLGFVYHVSSIFRWLSFDLGQYTGEKWTGGFFSYLTLTGS